MTFPNQSFALAQSTEFKVAETFRVDGSVDKDDVCCELGDVFI